MKKLILLLNMGGPRNLNEIEIFLKNMFNDPFILGVKNNFLRKILASFITKMRLKQARQNYAQIGSKSPLCEITERLCAKILKASDEFLVDFAMNYTPPFTKDVLKKYQDVAQIVLVPLYPHHSVTTITSSVNDFFRAYNELSLNANVMVVKPFYDDSDFNDLIVNDIKMASLGADISEISLIFSAHSLPQRVIDNGDLYEMNVLTQIEILKQKLNENNLFFKEIILAYQSRLGPVKWLEPSLNSVLSGLESKKALIYPLSFCIDNSETIFELDIEYKHLANSLNFEFFRVVKCPNDSDEFVNFILDYVKE
ncbi:ferrochelatase [Campylobacter gastrosuis]|uniref:Ferrochelatase n=1 Tax=Campylobacter gastrosuis TaxID=2974576 RepID=A0ABT7HSR2_9BACT|nr:ferrochelatase [Campylobacter gastrosuis]MDL0089658.1 ferrochelatase [Campylobacter gastrosuis]